MASKYIDFTAIMQVIGSVFKNPQLLDLNDKYTITEDDFADDFHKITFGAIYKVYELGAEKVSLISILDFLASRPKSEAIFKKNKGEEWLLKIEETCQPDAFDYYYGRLKKFSLLRAFDNYGIDVSDIYDPDNIFDTKKKQQQEEMLDNSSLEQIVIQVNNKIESIKMKYVDNSRDEAKQAGEGIKDLIENLKQHPEVGSPLYGPLINTVTRGARLKKFYLRSSATGVGKSICNSTIIPTPDGFRRVDEIKVGDYLFDAFGQPTKVLGVFPQGEREVWEVKFKDGRVAKCSKDHLWSFCSEGQQKQYKEQRKFYTETLEEISKRPLIKPGRGYQFLVPMQQAVNYPKKQYSIDPYIMGLTLGDGSFRYHDSKKAFQFSSSDEELVQYIANKNNWSYKQYKNHNQYSWYFEYNNNDLDKTHKLVWVQDLLLNYPELWNVKSENKFIPKDFLLGSKEQRLALLNGLLDTDGSVDKKGRVSYYTVSSYLRDDVIELCKSLGFKATWLEDNHKDSLPLYRIEIIGNPEDKIKLFVLKRKKELIMQWYNNGKRKENNLFNPIVEINKTRELEEMTCFLVDNEEHLFLMNDFIVTHNTRAMVADACYMACDEIYDENFGWIHNGIKQSVLFIATEQDLSEIQTLMLAFLSNVNEEHILNGTYINDEEERVNKAAEILADSPLYVECIPDFSLQDIENIIKKNIREHDIVACFYDYLHTSMKILEEVTKRSGGVKLREDNVLFMLATKLKDICNQYGIFIMTSTQLNAQFVEADTPDQNLLRGRI